MINRILMELYDDYEIGNIQSLIDFAKEKIGNNNLLEFYLNKVNREKVVYKYLKNVIQDENLPQYANVILNYLDLFKPKDFEKEIKFNKKRLTKFLESVATKK